LYYDPVCIEIGTLAHVLVDMAINASSLRRYYDQQAPNQSMHLFFFGG
jgi:hypothetical protein